MRHSAQSVGLSALLLAAIALFVGCATSGMQRSERAATTMQTVAEEISQVIVQLDATGSSLDDLTKYGQPDVAKAFSSYSANVVKMDKLAKRFAQHADDMSSRGKEYFAEWEKQGDAYTNPQIRRLSEERRAALSEVYDKIAENSIGVKSAFEAYMSDITEIQTYLSNDLTPRGINSITPTTHRVARDGESLKGAIIGVQTAIEHARREMAQGGTT